MAREATTAEGEAPKEPFGRAAPSACDREARFAAPPAERAVGTNAALGARAKAAATREDARAERRGSGAGDADRGGVLREGTGVGLAAGTSGANPAPGGEDAASVIAQASDAPRPADDGAPHGGPRVLSYREWPGKNRFYCNGRLMTGPKEDDLLKMGTWAAMLIPYGLFMAAAGPDLLSEMLPLFYALAALILLDVLLLLATSFTDPGIVPRQPRAPPPKGQHFRSSEAGGQRATEVWCSTCSLYRPPGCSHCRDCDNCVRDWDHHCPFVGNCIGRRNYGYFYCFLMSVSLSASAMAGACVVVSTGPEWERHYSPPRVFTMGVAAVMLFALVVALVIGCFTCFHASLILRNVTTKEWCRDREKTQQPAARADNRVRRLVYACCEPSEVQFVETAGGKGPAESYVELL